MVAGFQKPLGGEAGQLLLLRLPARAAVSPAWCLCCIEECWPSPLCLLPEKNNWQMVLERNFFVSTSAYSVVLVSQWLFCVQTWMQLSFVLCTLCVEVFYLLRLLQKGLEKMDTWFFSFTLNSLRKILLLIPVCRHIRSTREPEHTCNSNDNCTIPGFLRVLDSTACFWELFLIKLSLL